MNQQIKTIFQSFLTSKTWKGNTTKNHKHLSRFSMAKGAFKKGELSEARAIGLMWDFGFIEVSEKK
jgi:hypothetical protein